MMEFPALTVKLTSMLRERGRKGGREGGKVAERITGYLEWSRLGGWHGTLKESVFPRASMGIQQTVVHHPIVVCSLPPPPPPPLH